MAKTLVIDSDGQGARVPFLRGILTRSLQDAGLDFESAYSVASQVRHDLDDRREITSRELRSFVADHLKSAHHDEVFHQYHSLSQAHSAATILVRDPSGSAAPFSRGKLRQDLESCGVGADEASFITARIYDHLTARQVREISSGRMAEMTYRYLARELGGDVARRFLVWMDFVHKDRNLLLLIGGAPGSGKSTIATGLAHRLNIVRTQSTDMLREVMRVMIPERLMPVLHLSSFAAWRALPTLEHSSVDPEKFLENGYRAQAELLTVACEAVLQRAMKERVSIILEGVHVQPALQECVPKSAGVVVVPIMLAILKPEQMRLRLRGRGAQTPDRRSERYLESFDAIWQLQSLLLSEADRFGVPIIPNDDREKAVEQVMAIVIETLSNDLTASPKEVWSAI